MSLRTILFAVAATAAPIQLGATVNLNPVSTSVELFVNLYAPQLTPCNQKAVLTNPRAGLESLDAFV
jgi:hypothetical protein